MPTVDDELRFHLEQKTRIHSHMRPWPPCCSPSRYSPASSQPAALPASIPPPPSAPTEIRFPKMWDNPVLSFLGGVDMAWVLVITAGLLEIIWSFSMKQSQGFTRVAATVVTLVAALVSFVLLSISMRTLPLGTAYTVWTGIGTLGAFLAGVVVLGEPLTIGRIAAAVLIVAGLILMKLSTASPS
jgi:quaternary ammonium compound-resistance protein SugE